MLIKKTYSSFLLTTALVIFFTSLVFSQASFAGGGYSEQGTALSKALYKELIKQGICTDNQMCWNHLQMYRQDGKRIHLNMYGQKDTLLASKVAAFFVEKGLKITDGMPITFKVFPAQKEHYLGLKSIFGNNEEILKLELNK